MQHLATALAAAIVHISERSAASDDEEDDDIQVLELLAHLLGRASAEELSELDKARSLAADAKDEASRKNFEQMLENLGLES